MGVVASPVFAMHSDNPVVVNQDKPKVKDCDKKAEAKKDCPVPCCEKKKAECDKEKK